MHGELVQVMTGDGLRLDGFWHQADADGEGSLDAVICLHGVGGNFYGSSLWQSLAGAMAARGVSVLRVNTRGHDTISMAATSNGAVRQGACFETVSQCRLDITAWCRFLEERGCGRLGLVGHSLGAIKGIYAMAYEPCPAVAAVVAISPPRLSCAAFSSSPEADSFRPHLEEAERHVREGNSDRIIEVTFPFPMLITAGGYVEKYGPAENYNILRFAGRVRCPTLFVYGQKELDSGRVAFQGMPDALARLDGPRFRPRCEVIEEADHFYAGRLPALTELVVHWLDEAGQGGATGRRLSPG